MGFLTPAQKDSIRNAKSSLRENNVEIWRTPTTGGGGKRDAYQLLNSFASCTIWPASQAPRLIQSLPDLTMVRWEFAGFFPDSTDILMNDEIRMNSDRYEVVGLGKWRTSIVVALQRVIQ